MTHLVAPQELPQKVRYEPREVGLTRTSSPIVVEILEKQRRPAANYDTVERSGAANSAKGSPGSAKPEKRQEDLSDERIEQVMDEYLGE